MLETLWSRPTASLEDRSEIEAVGHRVLHGGSRYSRSVIVTNSVKAELEKLEEFAPLHNKINLQGIETAEKALGTARQIAVFDTAFHSTIPQAAAVYPGPYAWYESHHIKRYGFHGISHQYAAGRAAQMLRRELASLRMITCHLGNGCSLAAISEGRSVDTTMGFTPLEGLMMGSRSGSIDPGIMLYWLRDGKLSAEQLESVLNRDSGLQGISGISNDMRQILKAVESGHARSRLALDMFVHRVRQHIGAMLMSLGGLDALVFTGGIGEHAPRVRQMVCSSLGFLGLRLDREQNDRSRADQDIAAADSKVRVLVIQAREDWAIARECWRLCNTPDSGL